MRSTILVLSVLLLLTGMLAFAQDGQGQLCVRAFEDRNRNGSHLHGPLGLGVQGHVPGTAATDRAMSAVPIDAIQQCKFGQTQRKSQR